MKDPKHPPDDTSDEPTPRAVRAAPTARIAASAPAAPAPSAKRARVSGAPRARKRRYRWGAVLGRGGMGEVRAARDRRIGRSVAIKLMLEGDGDRPEARRRFVSEARVQGQLEHPSIVPVYDLGRHEDGRAYFAMKHVVGVTLGEVLRELRKGNPEFEAKYSLRRLLSNFQQVCLALEYAHARGVVHRDVKPSNLMFGDFGEVYILDWGIAKVIDAAPVDTRRVQRAANPDATSAGEVLGTPGFMAPEQITAPSAVDARADVYSLGAVLFQLLTLEPLHGSGSASDRARSTQEGADARASHRAPHRDIPPELDPICARATSLAPEDRYPTARALHDAIEAYLEGDRDTRLRAELAEQHVARARRATERMHEPGAAGAAQRQRALGEAGRALALDPKNGAAAAIVARLMLEPPREIPEEVREATDLILRSELRRGVRLASFALFGVIAASVFLPALGEIRSWSGVALILGAIVTTALYGIGTTTFRAHPSRLDMVIIALPIFVAIAGFSLIVGALMVPPVLAVAFSSVIAVTQWLGRARIPLIALTAASWIVPELLDWTGLSPTPAWRFHDGVFTVYPRLMEVPELATRGGLIALYLATTVVVSALLWKYASWVADSRERLHLQAWHLERIIPREADLRAGDSVRPPPPTALSLDDDPDLTRSERTSRSERSTRWDRS